MQQPGAWYSFKIQPVKKMQTDTKINNETHSSQESQQRIPLFTLNQEPPYWTVAIIHLLGGFILPCLCFCLLYEFPDVIAPRWKSWGGDSFAACLFSQPSLMPFYPLLAFSMMCLVLNMFRITHKTLSTLVRIGLYSGIILGIQYSIALTLAFQFVPLFIALGIMLIFYIIWFANRSYGSRPLLFIISAWAILSFLLIKSEAGKYLFAFPLFIIFGCLFSSPWLTLAVFLSACRRFWIHDKNIKHWSKFMDFCTGTWITAYMIALWRSMTHAAIQYAQLPNKDPGSGCYICTAAAQGHPWLVGSGDIINKNGKIIRVNRQMRNFKYAEILFKKCNPRLHAIIRGIYDSIGPILARHLVNPLLADLAYLSFKPMEWLILSILYLFFPGFIHQRDRLYKK